MLMYLVLLDLFFALLFLCLVIGDVLAHRREHQVHERILQYRPLTMYAHLLPIEKRETLSLEVVML